MSRRPARHHTRFAEAWLFGSEHGPPGCASAAYRAAMESDGTDNNTSAKASRMLRSKGVQTEIARLQAEAGQTARITPDQHVRRLMAVYDKAMRDGQYGAAVRAEKAAGECLGFYVARSFNLHADAADLTGEQSMERLRFLAAEHPGLVAMLADAAGLELRPRERDVVAEHLLPAAAPDSALAPPRPPKTHPGRAWSTSPSSTAAEDSEQDSTIQKEAPHE